MKRIVAKTGIYQKDGEEKSEWTKIGVILEKDGNEFILFDPSVNMAGVAYKQRVNGISKPDSDTVIASIFTDEPKQDAPAMAAQALANNQSFDDDIIF
jgi:hypothetical protein